jgi:hypothetical protein
MNGTAKIDEKASKSLPVNKLCLINTVKHISLIKTIDSRKQNVYGIFIFLMIFKTFRLILFKLLVWKQAKP